MTRGELDERLAARERERRAGGILKVRDDEEDARPDPGAADEALGLGDVETVIVRGHLEHAGAVVAQRRDRVREVRRLDDGDVAWPHEDARGKVDRLERSGGDDHVAVAAGDAALAHQAGDDRAELRVPLGDAVAERGGAVPLDHRAREVIHPDQLERLTGG